MHFPEAVSARFGEETFRIRLSTARRPRQASLTAWRAIDAFGQPVGPAEHPDFRYVRDQATNRLVVVFSAYVAGDYYLRLHARWKDSEGCRAPQDVSWTFHARGDP